MTDELAARLRAVALRTTRTMRDAAAACERLTLAMRARQPVPVPYKKSKHTYGR